MKQQTSCATETHNKSSKTIDYTGKTIHVGIDVHLKDWRTIAILWLLEIGDVRRFENIDRLNAYVGFCPDTNSSGETQHDRGISTRRHNQLRVNLIQAAWQAIRTDPAMLDTCQILIKRMKGTQAIVRIARKLIRRIRAIQLNEMPYPKGVVG